MKGTACVDFDGTIVTYDEWPGDDEYGAILEGAIRALQLLKDLGLKVVIFTARTDHAASLFIKENDLGAVVDEVTNVKPKEAIAFFDDRGIHVPTSQDGALEAAVLSFIFGREERARVIAE